MPLFNSLLQKLVMAGIKFFTFVLVLVLSMVATHARQVRYNVNFSGASTFTPDSTETRRNKTDVAKAVGAIKKACGSSWTSSFPAYVASCAIATAKKRTLTVCPQECKSFISTVPNKACKIAVTEGSRLLGNYQKLFRVCSNLI